MFEGLRQIADRIIGVSEPNWSHALSITLHTITASQHTHPQDPGIVTDTGSAVSYGVAKISSIDLKNEVGANRSWENTSTGQRYGIIAEPGAKQAFVISNKPLKDLDGIEEKVRELLGWPAAKPISLDLPFPPRSPSADAVWRAG